MTMTTDGDGPDLEPDFLDFAGAEALREAGQVGPAGAAAVDAAHRAVRKAVAQDMGWDVSRDGSHGVAVTAVTTVRRGRRRRRFMVSAVAVAAVVAGMLVLPVAEMGGTPPSSSANAATFLRDVAVVAGEKPAPQARYWKVHSRDTYRSGAIGEGTTWYSRNSITRSKTEDGEACQGDHCVVDEQLGKQTFWEVGPQRITWDQLAELPTDPRKLKATLLRGSTDGDREIYNGIVNLLATAPTGPDVRAALFEVLAGMRGVELIGPVKDSEGRQGTAVKWRHPSADHILVVDPASSTVLEHTQKDTLAGAPLTSTFLSTGPTPEIGWQDSESG
ncbi:CU044_5270 family protein [Streptomyces sp. NBC_01506]|uniref:CU044_5270 family protein n=1 Tax=Streptomyces sp. NBC_01506 TaxID=2903887 RepID=UPI00386B59DC